MSKKIILILFSAILFLGTRFAYASLIINEIMYSPKTSSWIEIYNDTDSAIDLTQYKILDTGAAVNGHGITLISGANPISTHAYAVIGTTTAISKFGSVEWPLFKASLAPIATNETSDTFILRLGTEIIDSVLFSNTNGANGDGNSLQLIDGSWVATTPTPGAVNENVTPPPPADDSSSSGSSSSGSTGSSTSITTTTPEPKIKVIENPTMKVKILANALAFAGEPLEIKTSVSGFSNENVVLGRAYWNFGDGGSLEQINNFEKFYHIYYYPGEYVLFLEYYQNSFSKTPEATSKMTIKVLPTTVTISKVGDAKDFFIELSNNASSDIDISNWFIRANGKTFVLPKNSVIMSKKQMTISGKITGFIYGDQADLKLYSSTGELVFDYNADIGSPKITIQPPKSPLSAGQSASSSSPDKGRLGGVEVAVLDSGVPVENLLATPAGAQVPLLPLIIPLASLVFIGTSAGAVYFIRRKKIIPQTGNDFEILDE